MKPVRITLALLGLAAMSYALLGAARDNDVLPVRHTGFLATVLVLHDAALVPAVIAVSVLVHRAVPPPHRAVLQAALIATAAATAVALPLVLGYGRTADNPSALTRDYAHGLLALLALIWLTAAVTLVVRRSRAGH
jgi:hypothetical protein